MGSELFKKVAHLDEKGIAMRTTRTRMQGLAAQKYSKISTWKKMLEH